MFSPPGLSRGSRKGSCNPSALGVFSAQRTDVIASASAGVLGNTIRLEVLSHEVSMMDVMGTTILGFAMVTLCFAEGLPNLEVVLPRV